MNNSCLWFEPNKNSNVGKRIGLPVCFELRPQGCGAMEIPTFWADTMQPGRWLRTFSRVKTSYVLSSGYHPICSGVLFLYLVCAVTVLRDVVRQRSQYCPGRVIHWQRNVNGVG